MKTIEIPVHVDDQNLVNEILRVSNQIHSVITKKLNRRSLDFNYEMLFQNIKTVLCRWTGYCSVGIPKPQKIKNAYQQFFVELYNLLLICKNNLPDGALKTFCGNALYQGKAYRYLGHGGSAHNIDMNEKIIPIYDDIYVSWSKNESNPYFVSKLKGVMTHLTCEINDNHYGIDLEVFDVSKANEAEIVYPTRKNGITIKYIRDKSEI